MQDEEGRGGFVCWDAVERQRPVAAAAGTNSSPHPVNNSNEMLVTRRNELLKDSAQGFQQIRSGLLEQ